MTRIPQRDPELLATLEAIVCALEGIASTFVGMAGKIPQSWITEDCQNIENAREKMDALSLDKEAPNA